MVPRQRREAVEEIPLRERRELLRGLGAIPFRDGCDDVFLGADVALAVACAHGGFGADSLHRRLMKAQACDTGLRRNENFVAAIGLQLDIGPAHEICARRQERANVHSQISFKG